MGAISRSARTAVGALVGVVLVAAGALPAAGQDTAATAQPALTVTAPEADAVVRSAPTVVVRAREPVAGVTARLVRDGTTLVEARQTEPSDTGAYLVGLSARRLAAVANGPARVQARAGDGDAWTGHPVVLDLDPLPTSVTATAEGDTVAVAWVPVPLAPEGRYEVQRSTDGQHFEHLAARESRTDTTLHDPDRPPGTYYYRVVVTRPGADPGTRRRATSPAVSVVVHEPEPEPRPTPEPQVTAQPSPQATAPPSPQATPPSPQPGSDPAPTDRVSPDRPSAQPADPAPGASADDASAEADAPGARDVESAGQQAPREPGAPRLSSALPRLQSRSGQAPDDMIAYDDVPAPQVAPPAGGAPDQATAADGAVPDQAIAAGPATLDVRSADPRPRPPMAALLGVVVFAAALFALRRRV